MKALSQLLPKRVLLLVSVLLTIPHIILFLDSTFPAAVCKDYAFLDLARSRSVLYLGSFYSAAISIWALNAKYGDFFSYHPSPPKQNGVPVETRTSPAMAREKSRYLCILKVVLLSDITLAIDLSWAWYQAVKHAWSMPVVTELGNLHKFMSSMMFPLMVSWLTMMWTLGNFIALAALANLIVVGEEAGVVQLVRRDRTPGGLQDDKEELPFEANDLG